MLKKLMKLEVVSPWTKTAVFGTDDGTDMVLRLDDFEELGEPSFVRVEVEADESTA